MSFFSQSHRTILNVSNCMEANTQYLEKRRRSGFSEKHALDVTLTTVSKYLNEDGKFP